MCPRIGFHAHRAIWFGTYNQSGAKGFLCEGVDDVQKSGDDSETQCRVIVYWIRQESPAIADKPARRESLPKIAPIRRAYDVVDDNTGLSSFV